jgi:hypothetical protein
MNLNGARRARRLMISREKLRIPDANGNSFVCIAAIGILHCNMSGCATRIPKAKAAGIPAASQAAAKVFSER